MMLDQVSNRNQRAVVQSDVRVVGQTKLFVLENADGVASVSRLETLVATDDNCSSWKVHSRGIMHHERSHVATVSFDFQVVNRPTIGFQFDSSYRHVVVGGIQIASVKFSIPLQSFR